MGDALDALLAILDADNNGAPPGPILLDWSTFWNGDTTDEEWLAQPVLPAGRSVAMFAPGGIGKSLLALWISAALATGRPVLGIERPPIDVLYLDYEMTTNDLRARLDEMDYGPDIDLSHLHYALLPDLAPLDTHDGGEAVVRLAAEVDARLVVIDTFSRAVAGEENDADTVRDWYRYTGQWLKHAGRAFLRIDHAGKNLERGQRGTSAKNDDVDVVWRMTARDDDVFELRALKRRMQWVPDRVELRREEVDNVLGYTLLNGTAQSYPQGTADCARLLDELGVPLDASRRRAATVYREAGYPVRNGVLGAALKYRRDRTTEMRGPLRGPLSEGGRGPLAGTKGAHPQYAGGTTLGTSGDHPVGQVGTTTRPPRDAWSPAPESDRGDALF